MMKQFTGYVVKYDDKNEQECEKNIHQANPIGTVIINCSYDYESAMIEAKKLEAIYGLKTSVKEIVFYQLAGNSKQ